MLQDWDVIYHIVTSLHLTLFPGVLCFGYKSLQNVCIEQHHLLFIGDVFESFNSPSEQEQAEEKGKSFGALSNHKRLDTPYQTMLISMIVLLSRNGSNCASSSVRDQAKASFSTVSFYKRRNYNQTQRLIQTGNWMDLCSCCNFSCVLRWRTSRQTNLTQGKQGGTASHHL